jgi:hypothetical protein
MTTTQAAADTNGAPPAKKGKVDADTAAADDSKDYDAETQKVGIFPFFKTVCSTGIFSETKLLFTLIFYC